jgi:ATP-dependent Clp protease ATP-binding subunit ClpB
MNLNRLTERSQEALREAQGLATRANNQGVDVEHLMLALLSQRDGIAIPLLQAAGAKEDQLRSRLQQEIERLPKVSGPAARPDQVTSPTPEQALTAAEDEAAALKDEYVSIEHFLRRPRRHRRHRPAVARAGSHPGHAHGGPAESER